MFGSIRDKSRIGHLQPRQQSAVGLDKIEVTADDDAIPELVQRRSQSLIPIGLRGEQQIDHDRFCAGVSEPLDERSPHGARPGVTLAQSGKHWIVLPFLRQNHVIITRTIDSD